MPKIPTLTPGGVGATSVATPPSRRTAAAAPGLALADAAEKVGRSVQAVGKLVSDAQAMKASADMNLKALEYENELDKDFGEFVKTYRDRLDYEEFTPDAEKFLLEKENTLLKTAGGNKTLEIAFKRKLNQQSADLRNIIATKETTAITNRALGAWEVSFNKQLENYAGEPDPTVREIIRTDIEIGTASLVASGVMTQKQAEVEIQSFNDQAEQVRADKLIEADPTGAEDAFRAGEFEMDPKLTQAKIEKAQLRQKQQAEAERQAVAAAKKQQDEILRKAHDAEEKTVGELFLTGEYDKVVPTLMESELLTGDELRTWSDAAAAKIKAKGTKQDKLEQSKGIVIINDMIAKDVDPRTIRNYILTHPNFTTENQEQYLNKVETSVKSEIDEGRKAGYLIIKGMLSPETDVLAGFIKTPLDIQAAAAAQGDLDDWLDAQIKDNKSPSIQEIRSKSTEFGQNRAVSLLDKIEHIRKQAEKLDLPEQ